MKLSKFSKALFSLFVLGGVLFLSSCDDSSEDPAPEAVVVDAGIDQTITLGETVSLDGSATGGTLIYIWEITSRPSGSVAFISNPLVASTTFVPDEVGEYVITLTATNDLGTEGSDEVIITVEPGEGPEEIGGSIDADLTLANRVEDPLLPDYIASTNVFVNAKLTIEPGVLIVFEDNVGISVSTSGALVSIGTSSENIVMTGVEKTDGFWKGLMLESNDGSNEITFTIIEFGGSSGFDGADLKSNLMVEGSGKVKVTNSTFRNGAGYGIYTRNLESDLPSFANNTITANEAPVMTRINHYHYFDSNSDYSGNNNDYIDTYWSNGDDVEEDVTWNALNVPYRMAPNVDQIAADVTIAAGANFIGQPNGGLQVIVGGSLNAVGTAADNITFVGEQDVRGYWKGLTFESNNTNNELTFVVVSNGGEEGFDGANLKSNIMVDESGRVKITNTTSSKSGGYGLYTRQLESALPDFSTNTFTDNVAPVMMRFNHYHYLDSDSDFTGNDDDYIDTYWSNGTDITQNVTWNALTVPYRMSPNIDEIDADVTIMAGAQFIGQPNGGIEVLANGSLNAVGTASDKITFTGEQDVTGYWKGLRFSSNNASNVLTNVLISNGGEEGFDGANRKANVEVGTSGRLNFTDSEITKSGGNGIRVQSGGNLTQSGLTFSGNLGTDIVID
jgi:hypothetical protein